jgi:hypothetical protein
MVAVARPRRPIRKVSVSSQAKEDTMSGVEVRTMQVKRLLGWLAAAALIAIVAAECMVFGIQFDNRRKAELLLKNVRTIYVGRSTESDVRNVIGSIGGNTIPAQSSASTLSYNVWIANGFLNQLGMKFPVLRRFGLEPWGVTAAFQIEQGKVRSFDYSLGLMRINQWKELRVGISAPAANPDVSRVSYFPRYSTGKFIEFTTIIYPDATQAERQRAFDLDLSCLTRFGGCSHPCELIPSAWTDYLNRAHDEDLRLPDDELSDSRCVKR